MQLLNKNGNYTVIRHMFKESEIEIGSDWISVEGLRVRVICVDGDWVGYTQFDGTTHEKDSFSFQCRYCLIVTDLEAFDSKYHGQYTHISEEEFDA